MKQRLTPKFQDMKHGDVIVTMGEVAEPGRQPLTAEPTRAV
jgi:hypothetical protein